MGCVLSWYASSIEVDTKVNVMINIHSNAPILRLSIYPMTQSNEVVPPIDIAIR